MFSTQKGPVYKSGACRGCGGLKRCRVLNAQYEFEGRPEVYSDIFLDCFGLLLSNQDDNSENSLICATCVIRLRDAYSFKLQVLAQEEKLYNSIAHVEIEVKMELGDGETKPCENVTSNVKDTSVKVKKESCVNIQNPIETDEEARDVLLRDMQLTKELIRKLQKTEEKPQATNIVQNHPPDKLHHVKPPDVVRMIQLAKLEAKASKNVETLVEYSYVCPFENIFSDLICVYCREVYSVPEELFLHTQQHDPKTFKEKRNKKKTALIDITRIDCRLCDATIDNIDQFKSHITNVHKKLYHPVTDAFIRFKLKQNSLQCVDCDLVFNFFFVLKRHMADHYGNHLCDLCGMHFFSEAQLRRHSDRKHTNKPCKCPECNQICKNVDYLKAHIHRAHRKDEIFECGRCHLRFMSYTEKSRHVAAIHSKGRTFKCTKCNNTFKDICVWREHKRLHAKNLKIQQTRALAKEDSLICPHCPKICLNKQGLRMHVKKIHEH